MLLVVAMLVVPAVLVSFQAKTPKDLQPQPQQQAKGREVKKAVPLQQGKDAIDVPVYLSREQRVIRVPLEAYIRGVVAAEMPADFNHEALKAQALAARTYIIDRIARHDFSDMERLYGADAAGAWVSDTVQHQVYYPDEALKANWGGAFQEKSSRINKAINDTRGQVITYAGRPIYAAFFSASNGRTENSEDYWQEKYPYLRSVDSSWDKQAPAYRADPVTMSLADFQSQLAQYTGKQFAIPVSAGNGEWLKVVRKTKGGKVAELTVGDETFTGREVREALNLRSSDFSWKIVGDRIAFTTRGYGHGVGMSQWGANYMAQEGKTAEQIVKHYYKGVKIEDYYQWVREKEQNKKRKG